MSHLNQRSLLPGNPEQRITSHLLLTDLAPGAKASEPISRDEAIALLGGVATAGIASSSTAHSGASSPTPTASAAVPPKAVAASTQPVAQPAHWSASIQNVLDQPPVSLPRQLIVGGIAFCCIFGAWSWVGKIEEVGHAQGRLVPEGEVYKIHPMVSGQVINVAVEEGQDVKAGQVILSLDDQIAEKEVERLEKALVAQQMQLIQTQGLIERTHLEATTHQAIIQAEIEAQEAAIEQAQAGMQMKRELITLVDAEIAVYEARLARLQPLVEEGAIAEAHLFEIEQSLRDRERVIAQYQGESEQSLVEVERLQAGLTQKQAEAQRSRLEAQQKLQQLEIEAMRLQAQMTETRTLLSSEKAKLSQFTLHAPVDGTVSALNIPNIGEVVQPGQTVIEIAPEGAPLVLSAQLPTREAGFVEVGMPVQMKFDAFPYQDFGVIPGRVKAISPDVEIDEEQGAVYNVEVVVNRDALTNEQQDISLNAGQTATAEVVIRERRIAEVLLDPIRQLQRGGIKL